METTRIFDKIKELGHVNSKREELQDYCKSKLELIHKLISRRVLNSDGADVLDCLFNGLSYQTAVPDKVKIIDAVMKVMRKESTSLSHCGDIVSRLCLELPKMPANDLVKWSADSIQSIVNNNDVNMIWNNVLPECLSALSNYSHVKHCGTELTSSEYKAQCVTTLCQCQWNENQLVRLADMFKDMQLNRNDHKQVVTKLCSYMIDIPPETIPPLFHQLLKLCKTYNLEVVMSYLSNYFNLRLYGKLEPPPQDSESTTMDIDDIVPYNEAELSRCLSTCIYHVSQGAADPELVKKHLKQWPKSQLLKNPFLLDVALALSDKGGDFRTACLDIIKSAIDQRLLDEQRRKESAWVRAVIPPDVDVANVLKVLTTESTAHRQLTALGLIHAAITLLGTRQKSSQNKCSLGELILVRLAKSQPETAPHILNQLADRLIGDVNGQEYYANCLYILCKLTPLSIERCSQLSTILENCQPSATGFKSSARVFEAVHPLLNFSTRVRDTLVMVCRKGLYSRDSFHRCLALSGFLTVLRHMKLPRTVMGSQSGSSEQFSAHSYLTQLTVDLHATQLGAPVSRIRNEAMCMEVVSIVRRCLLQDAAVKQLLYSKIYDCCKEKPVLHESILEMLYEHLIKFMSEDQNSKIMFDKCIHVTAITAVLTEPIAHLLYAIAQFLQITQDESLEDILESGNDCETASAYLKSKLISIMDSLCSNEDLANIDLEDHSLTDLTPESRAKCLQVQQILQSHEALMAHNIMQWNLNSVDVANNIYKLFKSYNGLLDKTKAPSKLSKKGSKSTLNETKETTKSQKSQKSQKDKGKGTKLSNLLKDRAGPFKPLPCLWDLRFCLRAIELLYSEEVAWSSLEQRNQIRSKRDFHHYVLKHVQNVLTSEQLDKRIVVHYVVKIAEVIYRRCLSRYQEISDFDEQTALSCVDVFKDCLTVILSPHYAFKIEDILSNITGNADTETDSVTIILERLHSILLKIDDDTEERDASVSRMILSLSNVASILLEIPTLKCSKIVLQLEDYIRKSKQDCLTLIPAVLTANCRVNQDTQFLDDLLLKLTRVLGKIDEEESTTGEDTEHFPSIDEKTGHTVLAHICTHIMNRLKHTEHLIQRGRDLQAALKCSTEANCTKIEKEISELVSSCVLQSCQSGAHVTRVGALRCVVGGGSERVMSVCARLYMTLTMLCRVVVGVDVGHLSRLDRLLKICGKKLSTVMDNLITYLEASQATKAASKVLKDTKLIPKLVLEAELFSNNVLTLESKLKINLHQYLSLGTARDFRIKAPVLQEVLNARENREEEEEPCINDAETTILSPRPLSDSDEENDERRPKRRRVS